MIITCTYNPAIDYRMEVNDFEEGKLNRTSFTKFVAGGKGINVSVVLKNLNVDNITTGFIGGFTGEFIKDFISNTYGLNHHFVEITDLTRVNVKLNNDGNESEINAKGPFITKEEHLQLLSRIDTLSKDDLVVIGGSPALGEADTYIPLIKRCKEKGIEFVIDTNKQSLLDSLKYHPILIKPNHHELEEIFDTEINTEKELIKYGKKLLDLGAKNIIISLGGEGSIFMNNTQTLKALPIQGDVKNTVGAGDSMVAGFVKGIHEKLSVVDAFKLAVSCGTSTAFSYDLATKIEVKNNLNKVLIEEVQ